MVSPWQRRLLTLSEEVGEDEGGLALSPEAAVVAVAVLVVLVMLTLLCACGDDGSGKEETERKGTSRKNANGIRTSSATADPAAVTVETEVAGESNHLSSAGEATPVSNGVANGPRSSSSPSGHSRQESSGSAQMRPTSLRELPDLPVSNHKRNHSGAGVVDKQTSGRGNAEETKNNDAYDHLGAKITNSKTASINYDHIKLESPRDLQSPGTTPASEPDTASEGHYAQVRERTYDVVKDVRSRASAKVAAAADYDPYAKVKDEEDDKEDPYSKVKDSEKEEAEDEYAHLKHDHVINFHTTDTTNLAMMEDEDPYEKVMGDSGGARVVGASNVVDPDDPYSVVSDQPQVMVVPLSSGTSPPRGAQAAASHPGGDGRNLGANLNNSAAGPLSQEELLRLQFADEEADTQDDYATVVKDRNPSTSREEGEPGRGGGEDEEEDDDEIEPYFTTPSEPPRMYDASEVGTLLGAVGGVPPDDASSRHMSKEHRYTKVTARESLASMTARNALNTYEIVPDLPENTYATVEGGSGDGVVRYANPGTPNLQHNSSHISETYAEIGASGGYANPAPEPPSLDSLHSMTKSTSSSDGDHFNNTNNNSRAPTSPSSTSPNVIIADDGYAVVSKTSGFSPSETALPQIPRAGTSGSMGSLGSFGEEVMINGVTLHPDYHSVKDCIPDQDNENDPNYESVDEALSKVPVPSALKSSPGANSGRSKGATGASPNVTLINHVSPSRRTHQYEEVSPPVSPMASPPLPGSSRGSAGVAGASSSNGPSPNGASSSGMVPRQPSIDAEAAEVRNRVLEGHMYEAISDVKTRHKNSQRKTDSYTNHDSTKL